MHALTTWQSAPEQPGLKSSAVHVWRIDMVSADTSFDILSRDEKERAERFTVVKPGRDYVVMRNALRMILSRYLNESPKKLTFTYNPHGKPLLADRQIHFNTSHSGDVGLIAITQSGDVGVDIEKVNDARATHDVAKRFFSPSENATLENVIEDDKTRAFFRCWCRKESVIKALGEGLSCPLSSFDVCLDEKNPALQELRREGARVDHWSMAHLYAHPEYEAAVAVIGSCREVAGYHFR